jgi:polyhydroxyalkanoate synthesis regulator phasin
MSDNKEDLQSLIDELRGKLGDNVSVELIDDLPEQSDEPQREPWIIRSLDDLEAMLSQAAEAITQAIESGECAESEASNGHTE